MTGGIFTIVLLAILHHLSYDVIVEQDRRVPRRLHRLRGRKPKP